MSRNAFSIFTLALISSSLPAQTYQGDPSIKTQMDENRQRAETQQQLYNQRQSEIKEQQRRQAEASAAKVEAMRKYNECVISHRSSRGC